MKRYIRAIYIKFVTLCRKIFIPLFSANSFLASLYYLLFSTSFRKEQHVALLATKAHLYRNERAALYRLRRLVHGLEKGLTNDNPKASFAEGYILSAVRDYLTIKNNSSNIDTALWASDVFEKYFETVEHSPIVRKAFQLFIVDETASKTQVPYRRQECEKSIMSFEQFRLLCEQRCSTRYYEQKKVPRELLEKAIEAALNSPSACNRIPFFFRIYDEHKIIQDVLQISYGVGTFAHNVQCLVLVCFDMVAYQKALDRHCGIIDGTLAAMAFMLALETLGLSSCPINWPEIKEKSDRLRKVIQIENTQRCIMMISVGYPKSDALVPYSAKIGVASLVNYNI